MLGRLKNIIINDRKLPIVSDTLFSHLLSDPRIQTTMSSKHPIPPTTLPSTSTISPLATTSGTHPLTIGQNTYIQVRAHLSTDHGPVTIGSGCVIGEYSTVGLQQQDSEKDDETIDDDVGAGPGEGVVIEDHVVIEAKAVIEGGTRIGEGTMVECGAKIGKGARVGKVGTALHIHLLNLLLSPKRFFDLTVQNGLGVLVLQDSAPVLGAAR